MHRPGASFESMRTIVGPRTLQGPWLSLDLSMAIVSMVIRIEPECSSQVPWKGACINATHSLAYLHTCWEGNTLEWTWMDGSPWGIGRSLSRDAELLPALSRLWVCYHQLRNNCPSYVIGVELALQPLMGRGRIGVCIILLWESTHCW